MHIRILLSVLVLLAIPVGVEATGPEGETEILFAEGLLEYNRGNYDEAQVSFARALVLDPDYAPAAYFLGMSYYRQEKYADAALAFKIAAKKDKKQPEPHFYRGISFYRMDLPYNALPELQRAHKVAGDGPLKELADSYIRVITGSSEWAEWRRRPWFFYTSLSTQYDSNVTLDPENITLTNLPSDQSDVQIAAQVGGGYHIIQRKKYRFTWEGYYFQTIYPDLNEFSFGLAHVELRNQVALGKFVLRLPAIYEFSLLGSDAYLQSPQLKPSLSHLAADRFLTRLTTLLRYHRFFESVIDPAQDRDAWNLVTELAEYIYFAKRRRYLKVSYSFEQNWAKGADWDYSAHTIGGAFYTPLAWDVSTYVYAFYTVDKNFSNVDSIIGTKRDDARHHYGIRFSWPVYYGLNLSVHYDFQRNSSNQAIFEYNKHLVGVTFDYRI